MGKILSGNTPHIIHVKSSQVIEGQPKLPVYGDGILVEGELAVNYAKGYETISIINNNSGITRFSSDEYYTEQKLGSGFTGANSGNTVTSVIEDNELVWTNAFVTLSGTVSSHTANTTVHITPTDKAKLDSITSNFGTMAYENTSSYSSATQVNTALNGYTTTATTSSLSGKTVTVIGSSNSSISANTSTAIDGTIKYDITTESSKISGLTAVSDSDEGAAKISGVSTTDSVKTGIKRLYDSLTSEIAARKAAILARTVTSSNKGIVVSETPNSDGFSTTVTLTLDGTTIGIGTEKTGNDNTITITDNGLFLSSTWTCGDF